MIDFLLSIVFAAHILLYLYGCRLTKKNNMMYDGYYMFLALIAGTLLYSYILNPSIDFLKILYLMFFSFYLITIYKSYIKKYMYSYIMIASLGFFTIASNVVFVYMSNYQGKNIELVRGDIKENIVKTYKQTSNKSTKAIMLITAKKFNNKNKDDSVESIVESLYKRITIYAMFFWSLLVTLLLYKHKRK